MSTSLTFSNQKQKWIGSYNGKIVVRSRSKEYAQRKLSEASGVNLGLDASVQIAVPVPCEFSPKERFGFIEDFIKLTVKGKIFSTILVGSGGLGKTTKVIQTLLAQGLKEDTPESEGGDFLVVRGFATPRALYELLWNYKDKILVLDDADGAFKDPTAQNLLKNCLDSKDERIVNWNTSREEGDGIPNRFTYRGKMIFISNKSLAEFPQPIISRSQFVDLTLTTPEKIEVIEDVFTKLPNDKIVKKDVLEFVKKHAENAKDLNIRTAVALLTLREEFGSKWERLAKYSFVN